jgi:hypothetical protein
MRLFYSLDSNPTILLIKYKHSLLNFLQQVEILTSSVSSFKKVGFWWCIGHSIDPNRSLNRDKSFILYRMVIGVNVSSCKYERKGLSIDVRCKDIKTS